MQMLLPQTNFKEKSAAKTLLCCLSLFSFLMLHAQTVEVYETNGDKSVLGQQQTSTLFNTGNDAEATITINEETTSQTIDGFGYMLTQGSAKVIKEMTEEVQNSLLNEIFNPVTGNGISVVRISIGASDLSDSLYTYNMSPGDINMNNFSLNGPDQRDLIPILKKIIAINPAIKVLATPWSPPIWMKTNNSYIGGRLDTQYYAAYARYFIRYFEEMKAQGLDVWAITPQNEPNNPNNEPSMSMNSTEQIDFINNHLGPAITASSFTTKIIAYDHNCDDLAFPIAVLNNSSFVDGAAFHLYDPGINTPGMSQVHDATGKNIYFTEQFTASDGNFDGDFGFHTEHVVIGSLRNWSKTVIEWNLASDSNFEPRTPGGCTTCLGAITVKDNTNFDRNVSYYIISQLSRFIKPGAIRTASNIEGILNVSFINPDDSRVLLVYNKTGGDQNVKVNWKDKNFQYNVASRSAITFVWQDNETGNEPSIPIINDGDYMIISAANNQAITAPETSTDFQAMAAAPDESDANQIWTFTYNETNDTYTIQNTGTGNFIGIKDNWCGDFGNVQGRFTAADTNREFRILEADLEGTYTIEIGFDTCNFESVNDPIKAFDLDGGGVTANVNTFTKDSSNPNQQFRFVSLLTLNTTSFEKAEEVFTVYPIPAKDVITIHTSINTNYTIQLATILGEVVSSVEVKGGTKNSTINVQKLSNGVYFLSFIDPNSNNVLAVERILISK